MTMDDVLIGKKLGDYVIQGLLGRGGMSRVYQGYDENLQRYAAVKVISGDFLTTSEEEYTRRFQSEARAIAHLRHPNIVGVYQFGRWEGLYYMAQVFLEGKDLRQLLKEYAQLHKRIPVRNLLRIAHDVASALDYAHEQGVIHRDVKPSNIMLEKKTGRAILMDFGLALTVQEGTTGDTFGSAHYIAPEQAISSAKAVPQSDLYALAVVIYEMLAGTVPFDDPSAMSVVLKHLNDVPPPLSRFNPDLPPAVEQVILRGLDKSPHHRYATVRAFVDALEAAFAGEDAAALDSGTTANDVPELPSTQPLFQSRSSGVAPAEEESGGGIAARFMRRKAQKEAETALAELDESAFQIDEITLDSILSSYADPSEVGLVGDDAKGVSRPSAPSAQPELAPPDKPPDTPRRRSRVRLLLVLLLVAVGALGAVLLSTQNEGDNIASGVLSQDATATAAALAALPSQSVTPGTGTESTPAPDTGATATRDAALVVTDDPTSEANGTLVTTTPAAADATSAGAVVETSDLRMTYDSASFLLVNVSGQTIDISPLVFEQITADGQVRTFAATLWDQDAVVPTSRMVPGGCYQILTTTAAQRIPSRDVCARLLGFYQSSLVQRYFWIASQPGASFTVRSAEADAPLGTCAVDDGACSIMVLTADAAPASTSTDAPATARPTATLTPSPAPTATITPTPTRRPSATPQPTVTPTATALPTATPTVVLTEAPPPSVRMVYDDQTLLVINISDRDLDISALEFSRAMPDGTQRSFSASTWRDAARMGAGGCFQVLWGDALQVVPPDSLCDRFLSWFRTTVPGRYFWMADAPGATFEVRIPDNPVPLATCSIAAGECAFYLPPQD